MDKVKDIKNEQKFVDYTAFSCTAIIDNAKLEISKLPICPRCGRPLVPFKLAIDMGITRNPAKIMLNEQERVITEQTAYICEVSCDEEKIVRQPVSRKPLYANNP